MIWDDPLFFDDDLLFYNNSSHGVARCHRISILQLCASQTKY